MNICSEVSLNCPIRATDSSANKCCQSMNHWSRRFWHQSMLQKQCLRERLKQTTGHYICHNVYAQACTQSAPLPGIVRYLWTCVNAISSLWWSSQPSTCLPSLSAEHLCSFSPVEMFLSCDLIYWNLTAISCAFAHVNAILFPHS